MYSKFENLPGEKREKIIRKAMEEFAENGYEKASTNAIVRNADISKGILFHYFGSKKNLYLYVLDYTIDYFFEQLMADMENMSRDIFERIYEWSLKKIRVSADNPLMYKILTDMALNTPEELKGEIALRFSHLRSKGIRIVLDNIDTSSFRSNLDTNNAMEFIFLAMDAIGSKFTKMYKGREQEMINAMDGIMAEMKVCLDMLKFGICEVNKK